MRGGLSPSRFRRGWRRGLTRWGGVNYALGTAGLDVWGGACWEAEAVLR